MIFRNSTKPPNQQGNNGGLRRRPNEASLEKTMENTVFLKTVPTYTKVLRVNQTIWAKINPSLRQADNAAQKNQKLLLKAVVPIVNLIDELGNGTIAFLSSLTDSFPSDRMLSSLSVLRCQARKYVIKTDPMDPYTKLCGWKPSVWNFYLVMKFPRAPRTLLT